MDGTLVDSTTGVIGAWATFAKTYPGLDVETILHSNYLTPQSNHSAIQSIFSQARTASGLWIILQSGVVSPIQNSSRYLCSQLPCIRVSLTAAALLG